MWFGATIRELLSASYREDLQRVRAAHTLPEAGEPTALYDLAAHLERTFGIEISEDDLERLGTVRDVLQCVRLHLWERRVGLAAATHDVASRADEHPVAFSGDDLRRRFRRYTPAAPNVPTRPSTRPPNGRSQRP